MLIYSIANSSKGKAKNVLVTAPSDLASCFESVVVPAQMEMEEVIIFEW